MGSAHGYNMITHIYYIYTLRNLHVSWLTRAMTITQEWNGCGKKKKNLLACFSTEWVEISTNSMFWLSTYIHLFLSSYWQGIHRHVG